MRSIAWLLFVILLVPACTPVRRSNGGDDDDASDDDDAANDDDAADDDDASDDDDAADDDDFADDDDAAIDAVIVEAHPEPGESDVFAGGDLWVEFDRSVGDAGYVLSGPSGDVSGSATLDGRVLTFSPNAGLEPSTTYEVAVTWDTSAADWTFSTSSTGTPLITPDIIVGRVFAGDLANATFVEPPGVGPILQSQIGDIVLLCDVHPESDLDGGEVHFVIGVGEWSGPSVEVDPCQPSTIGTAGADGVLNTADDAPGTFNNPYFSASGLEMQMDVQGLSTTLQDVEMSGAWSSDASVIQGGVLEGMMDTRPLAPELDPEGGEDAICQLVMETVGVSCEECGPPNPGEFCLSVRAENIVSDWIPGLELPVRTCIDILADVSCMDEWDQWDDDGDGVYEGCPGS